MSKKKGNRTERELFHLFHKSNWQPLRIAGSGSTPIPAVDLIAGKNKRIVAIECKASRPTTKYLEPEDLDQLKHVAATMGVEPWLAVKFDYKDWLFIKPEDIKRTKTNKLNISLKEIRYKSITFRQLTDENRIR